MTTNRKDFDYEIKDINLLRVSLQVLQENERKGVFVGLAAGTAVFAGLRYRTNFRGILLYGSTLIGGVTGYNVYTHQARINYARLASICNKNASLKLNEMMR